MNTDRTPQATRFTVDSRVRVQLPNWDGPGCIAYTIKSINADRGTATLNPPSLPGGSTNCPTVPLGQLVLA